MIVYAVNVHTGGGKILLDELLLNTPFGPITALFCDERFMIPGHATCQFPIFKIKPTIFQRLKAELLLKTFCQEHQASQILFFGNLPPLFFKPKKGILYLQNAFLLPGIKIETHSVKTCLRLQLEKLILRLFLKNISEIWVQSEWMIEGAKKFSGHPLLLKKPFLPTMPIAKSVPKVYDFITVSSLSKHKNFDIFLKALQLLDKNLGGKIRVLAVLDSDFSTRDLFSLDFKNIHLEVKAYVTRNDLFELYEKSRFAVITSSLESFCLPAYEALHFQLKVICLKRPYLTDIKQGLIFYETNSPQALMEKMKAELL